MLGSVTSDLTVDNNIVFLDGMTKNEKILIGVDMDKSFRIILTLLLVAVAGIQFSQVITRYVLGVPFVGLQDLLMYPVLWLYILGSVNASREDQQIRANVLEIFLKTEWAKKVQLIISDIISLIIAGWLTFWAWDFFMYSLKVEKMTPVLYLPTVYSDAALFLGLLAMCAFTVINIVKRLRSLSNKKGVVKNA